MPDPIYNNGRQPQTRVDRPDPRISVGQGVSIASLAGLIEVPMLDARGAAAEGRGYAALGEGIANLGGSMGELAKMQAKAINIKRVTEHENELSAIASSIRVEQEQERDETKWGSILEKHLGALPPLRDDLSPDARDHIEARRAAWKTDIVEETQIRSAKKSIQDADADLDTMRRAASASGDTKRANDLAVEQEKNGARPKGFAELAAINHAEEAEQLANKQKAEEFKQMQDLAIVSVKHIGLEDTLRAIDKGMFGSDQSNAESLRDTVKSVYADRQQESIAEVSDRIYVEDPTKRITAKEIDALPDTFLPKTAKAQLNAKLAQYNNADVRANVAANAVFYSAQLSAAIGDYDPSQEKDQKYPYKFSDLWTRVNMLPVGNRAHLHAKLQRRANPAKTSNLPKSVMEVMDDTLTSYFNEGGFGKFKAVRTLSSGVQIPIPGASDNEPAKRQALLQMGKAKEEFLRWASDHPDAKLTDPETAKEMTRIIGKYVGGGFVAPMPIPGAGTPPAVQNVDNILNKYGAPKPDQAAIDAENERLRKSKSYQQLRKEGVSSSTNAPYALPPLPGDDEEEGLLNPNLLMELPPPPQ